jgi:hypothetical protein
MSLLRRLPPVSEPEGATLGKRRGSVRVSYLVVCGIAKGFCTWAYEDLSRYLAR